MKKPIKVLHVLDILAVAGIQQQILTLLINIDQNKIHSTVCTLFSRDESVPEPIADEIRKLGIKVIPLAMQSWRDISTIIKLRNIIKEEKIDIIHGHSAQVDFWACFLAKILQNKKTVYTKNDIRKLQQFDNFAPKLQYWLLNKIFADKIITVSDAIRYQLIEQYKINRSKITTIYNPVDIESFNPNISGHDIRKEIKISESTPLIGCVSRLVPRKGFEVFLKTAAIVISEVPTANFVIVGHGREEKNLRKMATDLNIQKNIHWLISRRDIPEILNAIDIFLFTTLWREGFGIVVIEAMACGLPVICSNVGPLPEIVIDSKTGYLPEPKKWVLEIETANPKPFAEKIIYLINNPDIAKKMGTAARKRVEENFSARIIAKKYQELYQNLILH